MEKAILNPNLLAKAMKLSKIVLMYGIVKNSFFAVSSTLLLLSLSLKIVRNFFLAWSLVLDRILSNMKTRR